MEKLKISLLQCELSWENAKANRTQLELYFEALEDTDLVLLPEMFSTGFSIESTHLAETMQGETVEWMKKTAHKKDAVICGSLMIIEAGNIYNRLLWVEPNGAIQHYDKRHLFSLINEEKHITAGNNRLIVTYKGWKICPLICYDLRFPVFSRNDVNYDLCFYLANWPNKRIKAWDTLLKARAIENQSYIIGVNRIGTDGYNAEYSGHSQVVDPMGEVIAAAPDNEIGWIEVSLSKDHLTTIRKKIPFLSDRDPFNLE